MARVPGDGTCPWRWHVSLAMVALAMTDCVLSSPLAWYLPGCWPAACLVLMTSVLMASRLGSFRAALQELTMADAALASRVQVIPIASDRFRLLPIASNSRRRPRLARACGCS